MPAEAARQRRRPSAAFAGGGDAPRRGGWQQARDWRNRSPRGEIRLERVQRGSEDTHVYAQAVFFREQDPLQRAFLGDEIASLDNRVYCYDVPGRAIWGHGPSIEGQTIANTRAYLDVGDTVTLASEGTRIVLQKQPEGSLERDHG